MWLELAGSGAAWLAHTTWYVGRAKRRALFGAWLSDRGGVALSVSAWAWLTLALTCWIAEHGSTLGTACWLAAVTAAASFNAVAAPLAPRGILVGAGLATLGAGVGLIGWIRGA